MTSYERGGDVMDVVTELRGAFSARDALYRQLNELVFREREIHIPRAYQRYALSVHSPLAFYVCHVLASTLSANDKAIQLAPFQTGQAGDINATRRERWHESAWERQEDDAQRSLYFPWMFALVQKGEAIFKTMQRSQRLWKDYYHFSNDLYQRLAKDDSLTQDQREESYSKRADEYKRQAPFPIVTTDVVPESFWYILTEDGISCAVEALEIPYNRAFALFKGGRSVDGKEITPAALGLPHAEGDGRSGTSDMVKLFALWDCKHVTYCVDAPHTSESYVAKSVAHNYGDERRGVLKGPFFRCEGLPTGQRRHDLRSVGLLWAFMDIFPLIDAALTSQGQVSFYTGWPWLEQDPQVLGKGGGVSPEESWGDIPNSGDQKLQEITVEPGEALPPGLRFAQPPRTGGELDSFMARLMYFMELLLPPVLRGGGNATSGYDTNQRVHMSLLNLDMFVKNAQRCLSRREAWIDELITLIGETVYVEHAVKVPYQVRARAEYLGLGPEDVARGRHYHVRLEPSTPSNEALLVKQLMDEKMAGWETDAGALERLGRNYDEVQLQRQIEETMNSPQVKQEINRQIFQRLGVEQQEQLQQANQQFAELLGQGYGQPPGGPPSMMPANQGGVYAPGVNMPTGPPGAQPGQSPGGGGRPPGGSSGVRRPPANAYPLPGQGVGVGG